MEIDEKELVEQVKKDILKSKNYVKMEIIVGKDKMPYTALRCHGDVEILGKTIMLLENLAHEMKEQYPKEYLLARLMYRIDSQGTVDMNED